MIYFTAHTFNCVCHCIRAMFRVLGMYNFDLRSKPFQKPPDQWPAKFRSRQIGHELLALVALKASWTDVLPSEMQRLSAKAT